MSGGPFFTSGLRTRISVVVWQIDIVIDFDHLSVAVANPHPTIVRLLLLNHGVVCRVDDQATLLETCRDHAGIV